MSVQEILTAIAKLPEDQRQTVLDALDAQYHHTAPEETPEEVERIRALLDVGLAELERGEGIEWDYDDFIRRARQRHAESQI